MNIVDIVDQQKLFMDRVEKLTNERWCPYPSGLFVEVVLKVDDVTAKELIEERRKYLFPHFLGGDPQHKRLIELNK